MTEIKLTNIPTLSVGKVVDTLSESYSAVIEKKIPLKTLPSVMLWGAPGVGKSQAVRQIAKEIERRTGKKVVVTDVRLLLFNPIDLRGIPTANEDKTLAVWLKPQIFQMDERDSVVNILFLDEISSAPQSVQASAYQITLDRTVGEHRLPENCIVISAGNRTTDKSVAYKMPKALANRLMHFQVEGSFESWKAWAIEHGIHEKVLGFLSFRQTYLMGFNTETDDLAFATPRSWEMVSNVLNAVSGEVEKVYPQIAGLVGSGVAVEFLSWEKVYASLPSIEDIFNGKNPPMPKNGDTMYALSASMVAYARAHKEEYRRIGNSISYALRMPPDFSLLVMRDYTCIEKGYREKLMRIPEFSEWLRKRGAYFNGSF